MKGIDAQSYEGVADGAEADGDADEIAANEGGLSHVLVCGGTLHEWRQASVGEWKLQLDTFVDSVHESGARWLSVCPYAGPSGFEDEIAATVLDACGGQRNGNRISFIAKDGLVVVVDLCADGRGPKG